MRVLVTGGAGFIGRHLVKSLLEQNHIVTIFDNFSNSDKNSITYLSELGAKIIEGNISNKKQISNAIKDQQIVIHLAAKISVSESIKNPQETMYVNVEGTISVLEECKKKKVENIIIASSAAVYEDAGSPETTIDEESKTNPISPYGKSKLIMEQKIREFVEANKINCIIFRFFNIYGVGQSAEYAGVISKFAEQIRKNMPLIIFGDGHQTRDFVAVEDVVNLIARLISSNIEKRGEIYNVGCGYSTSILELANLMKKLSKRELETKFEGSREGEIEYSAASIKKSQEELNYIPRVKLSQGLIKFF